MEEGIENLNSINFELQLMMIDEFNLVEKHEQGDSDNISVMAKSLYMNTDRERIRTLGLKEEQMKHSRRIEQDDKILKDEKKQNHQIKQFLKQFTRETLNNLQTNMVTLTTQCRELELYAKKIQVCNEKERAADKVDDRLE